MHCKRFLREAFQTPRHWQPLQTIKLDAKSTLGSTISIQVPGERSDNGNRGNFVIFYCDTATVIWLAGKLETETRATRS